MLTFSMINQEKYKWLKNSDLYKNLNDEITDIYCSDDCLNLEFFCKGHIIIYYYEYT